MTDNEKKGNNCSKGKPIPQKPIDLRATLKESYETKEYPMLKAKKR